MVSPIPDYIDFETLSSHYVSPLVINDKDREWILGALDEVIADCHKVPGAIWDLGKTLTGHALKSKAG